ncbi:hypothetical protein HCU64_08360 [Methylobacterium sp. C25]|uniref:hypothetical protein n=1 Tax=Methylobacterium sp. C25 TaxID=2721622 RepID=UPI001F1B9AEA|nr:hypothetical protein [Methylobacterium sp. C25]MCE4223759.1 hypothetical protein [Methylobacterium sp. C25]
MALPYALPLAEALVFTVGCAVLNARRFNPERVGVVLTLIVAVLFFAILIVGTATEGVEVAVPGPDELHSVLE